MHMRIRYHFLTDLNVTRHSRETESEKRIRNKTKQNLLELNYLQTEIVIIDPNPYQSTPFLYTIENSPMDLSRESQTSTSISEFYHQ